MIKPLPQFIITSFILLLSICRSSFGADEQAKQRQILLLGGRTTLEGDIGEVTKESLGGGLGFRYVKSRLGIEAQANHAIFERKNTENFALEGDIRILSNELSGLYYFGPPFQLRGFIKAGTGVAYSKLKLSHATATLKSRDLLALVGMGIDFTTNSRIGGLIEFNLKRIFMEGEDIRSSGVITALTYNW